MFTICNNKYSLLNLILFKPCHMCCYNKLSIQYQLVSRFNCNLVIALPLRRVQHRAIKFNSTNKCDYKFQLNVCVRVCVFYTPAAINCIACCRVLHVTAHLPALYAADRSTVSTYMQCGVFARALWGMCNSPAH